MKARQDWGVACLEKVENHTDPSIRAKRAAESYSTVLDMITTREKALLLTGVIQNSLFGPVLYDHC